MAVCPHCAARQVSTQVENVIDCEGRTPATICYTASKSFAALRSIAETTILRTTVTHTLEILRRDDSGILRPSEGRMRLSVCGSNT